MTKREKIPVVLRSNCSAEECRELKQSQETKNVTHSNSVTPLMLMSLMSTNIHKAHSSANEKRVCCGRKQHCTHVHCTLVMRKHCLDEVLAVPSWKTSQKQQDKNKYKYQDVQVPSSTYRYHQVSTYKYQDSYKYHKYNLNPLHDEMILYETWKMHVHV